MKIITMLMINESPPKKIRKIRVRRKKRGKMLDLDAAEREIMQLGFIDIEPTEEEYQCPKCGNPLLENNGDCSKCGISFENDDVDYACPKCGFIIEIEANFCPKCGIGLENAANEVINKETFEEGLKAESNPKGDTIDSEIPEKESFNCPVCGAVVYASTLACPECGYKLEENVEEFKCPKCEHKVYADTVICPGCGFNLDE